MRASILFLLTAVATASTGAAQTPDPLGLTPVTLPPELDRVLRDYEAAWKAGDGQKLASLFIEDGVSMHNGSLPIKGRTALAQSHTRPGGDLLLRAFSWGASDSVGYIVGGYRYPNSVGPGGQYVLALRRGGDGRWLIAADIDNAASRGR